MCPSPPRRRAFRRRAKPEVGLLDPSSRRSRLRSFHAIDTGRGLRRWPRLRRRQPQGFTYLYRQEHDGTNDSNRGRIAFVRLHEGRI